MCTNQLPHTYTQFCMIWLSCLRSRKRNFSHVILPTSSSGEQQRRQCDDNAQRSQQISSRDLLRRIWNIQIRLPSSAGSFPCPLQLRSPASFLYKSSETNPDPLSSAMSATTTIAACSSSGNSPPTAATRNRKSIPCDHRSLVNPDGMHGCDLLHEIRQRQRLSFLAVNPMIVTTTSGIRARRGSLGLLSSQSSDSPLRSKSLPLSYLGEEITSVRVAG